MSAEDKWTRIPSGEYIHGVINGWQQRVDDINAKISETFEQGDYLEDLLVEKLWLKNHIVHYTNVLNGDSHELAGDDTA